MHRKPLVHLGRLLLLVLLCLFSAPMALAHPMGNFSINHYSGIHIGRDAVELRYIIDIAEIPTYQQIQEAGIIAQAGDPTLPPYLVRQSEAWKANLQLSLNEEPLHLTTVSRTVIFPPGAGGLPTMKIGVLYRAPIHQKNPDAPLRLRYRDDNFAGHAGWKEIVVTSAPGITLTTNPFLTDRSAQLTDYPTSLLNSPPQDLEADLTWHTTPPLIESQPTPATQPTTTQQQLQAKQQTPDPLPPVSKPLSHGPSAAQTLPHLPAVPSSVTSSAPSPDLILAPNRQATPRSRFTELMTTRKLSLWFLLTAAFFAAGLGALHALEPGHGKTIVAAYLVGSRGRARHAVGLGLLVTASHTAGVYALGAIVLYASKYIIPEQIYPWLSIFSGLIIAVLAGYLMLRAWNGLAADEAHREGVLHTHWYSPRRTVPENNLTAQSSASSVSLAAEEDRTVPLRQLLILGITGGIIPCPAALVVLLAAVSLHRIAFGLYLIVAFSAGLAAVLIGIGILMVRARGLLSRWKNDAPWMQRWLPLASASAMFLAGLAIAATALPAAGFHLAFPRDHLASFAAIVGLGLVLGMRHSTDPDHVVAVSTIVSRERSVKQGAVIGMMWGLGHTLTIFIVGAAIILFKLTIPPRLGLSMEMAVAAMLILLGVLNLTGLLQRLTARFTPAAWNATQTAAELKPTLLTRFGYYNLLRPLAIGLVHGLAGSAAVALLVLSMIPSPAWACAYLVVFGLGTVAGMMLMTTAIAIPIALTSGRFTRYLTVASGLASITFGLFLVYHLGFVDGLFTNHVHWTPE